MGDGRRGHEDFVGFDGGWRRGAHDAGLPPLFGQLILGGQAMVRDGS